MTCTAASRRASDDMLTGDDGAFAVSGVTRALYCSPRGPESVSAVNVTVSGEVSGTTGLTRTMSAPMSVAPIVSFWALPSAITNGPVPLPGLVASEHPNPDAPSAHTSRQYRARPFTQTICCSDQPLPRGSRLFP